MVFEEYKAIKGNKRQSKRLSEQESIGLKLPDRHLKSSRDSNGGGKAYEAFFMDSQNLSYFYIIHLGCFYTSNSGQPRIQFTALCLIKYPICPCVYRLFNHSDCGGF